MGSDDESEKDKKVVSRQPSASSKKSANVSPEMQYSDKGDYKRHKDIRVKGKRTKLNCPNCKQDIKTKIKFKKGDYTWNFANWCCWYTFCLCCPFSWVPYAFDNWKDVYHKCPECKYRIAKWERDYCSCGDMECCDEIEKYGPGGKI